MPFWKSLLGGGSSKGGGSSSSSTVVNNASDPRSAASSGNSSPSLSASTSSTQSNSTSRPAGRAGVGAGTTRTATTAGNGSKNSSPASSSPSLSSAAAAGASSKTRQGAASHRSGAPGGATTGSSMTSGAARNAGAGTGAATTGGKPLSSRAASSSTIVPGQQGNTTPPASSSSAAPPASQPIGIPISQVVSNTASSAAASSAGGFTTENDEGDTDADLDPLPTTPYSTGHSPSHARHKFPSPSKQPSSSTSPEEASNEDTVEHLADGNAQPGGAAVAPGPSAAVSSSTSSSGAGRAPRQTGSVSSVSSNISKVPSSSSISSGVAGTSTSANTKSSATSTASSARPDIPTTHTILANPLPQPSTGLAAAISSVLPSSSSRDGNSSGLLSNGKSGRDNGDTGPRTFDIDDMIMRLLDAGYSGKLTKSVCLKNSEIQAICSAAREVFLSQPTLLELSPPVKIVGDVHGQYSDLIRLFEMCGFPPKANYLFLGDYVDRGKQSLETILLLLCYKIKYPENFFLLRGNHECANVTRVYGFYDECKRRCSIKIWKTFIDVFNCLPITAIVAGKIFCVHGGLSPSLSSMDDIRRISRPTDVPDYGLLNDLLWSDPSDTALDWEDNERGVSYCFGKAVIQDFLAKYDFDLICRAHMVVEDGYEFWNERTLVTIFSAPNYCGEFDNFGSVLVTNEDLLCAFELLKPLDGPALKKELSKMKRKNSAAIAAGIANA